MSSRACVMYLVWLTKTICTHAVLCYYEKTICMYSRDVYVCSVAYCSVWPVRLGGLEFQIKRKETFCKYCLVSFFLV
jgi:hypothetical protein